MLYLNAALCLSTASHSSACLADESVHFFSIMTSNVIRAELWQSLLLAVLNVLSVTAVDWRNKETEPDKQSYLSIYLYLYIYLKQAS